MVEKFLLAIGERNNFYFMCVVQIIVVAKLMVKELK